MTLDAMDWVWKHSQSKGNTRVALRFVADRVRTPACEVRLSYAEFMEALNTTSRSTVSSAITAAEKLGELVIVDEGVGRRASVYRLPKAVGYVRAASRSGPEVGPQEVRSGPEVGPQSTDPETPSGPEVGPQEVRSGPTFGASGPEVGPPPPSPTTNPPTQGWTAGQQGDPFTACQPLIQAMTDADINVSWQMRPEQWIDVFRVVERAGVDAMVRFAVATKRASRQEIRFASFFLRSGWLGLPPKSNKPLAPAGANGAWPPHCGDISCEPATRLRDVVRDGLPELMPCPECHPTSQRAHT